MHDFVPLRGLLLSNSLLFKLNRDQMSDEEEITDAMKGLLRAESGFSKSFDEDEQADIELVEEQLLSFYSKQLEHPLQKHRSTLKKTVPLPIHGPHAYPCQDTHSLPCIPQKWPQRPVRCNALFLFLFSLRM